MSKSAGQTERVPGHRTELNPNGDPSTDQESVSSPGRKPRLLFHVGGEGDAERVDVADLFAGRLKNFFDTQFVIFDKDSGPAWQLREFHGERAFAVGRSPAGGMIGSLSNLTRKILADIRTVWLAFTGPYDVVQIRDRYLVALPALIAARLRGRQYFYWLSYPLAEGRRIRAEANSSPLKFVLILRARIELALLYKLVMPRADHVFVQSEQMREDIAAAGVPRDRMTPVPMGIHEDLLEMPAAPQPAAKEILYLGILVRVRRLEILIDALVFVLERHPDARLVYVGDGLVPEDRGSLERYARDSGVAEHVEFTGMLPMDEAHDRVRRATVCVSPFYPIPILLSTSPTKLCEYMALGRPVVATEHPEQSAIIAASRAGFCVGWSAEEFADAFCAILDDPSLAAEMGERGKAYIAEHRTYRKIAEDLVRHYRRELK